MSWNFLPRVPQSTTDTYQIDLNRALNGWWREYEQVITSVAVQANGDVLLGQTAGKSYPHIPVVSGTPSGTPTTVTGFAPLVIGGTTAAPILYAYIGGTWKAL